MRIRQIIRAAIIAVIAALIICSIILVGSETGYLAGYPPYFFIIKYFQMIFKGVNIQMQYLFKISYLQQSSFCNF